MGRGSETRGLVWAARGGIELVPSPVGLLHPAIPEVKKSSVVARGKDQVTVTPRGVAGKSTVAPRAPLRWAGKARDRGVADATAQGAERSQRAAEVAECR